MKDKTRRRLEELERQCRELQLQINASNDRLAKALELATIGFHLFELAMKRERSNGRSTGEEQV